VCSRCSISNRSSSRLKNKSDEVTSHEGEGDGFRRNASVSDTVVDYDSGEHEVDCCCEEDGSDCEADDISFLHQHFHFQSPEVNV
jgi:hypothetical protein